MNVKLMKSQFCAGNCVASSACFYGPRREFLDGPIFSIR
ncbi:putative lipoprotein [Treponema primitia ZAS-2]|uniref:Putative lipoprotein n=1 Tax=Treponema primitia (strain ATCC BAA-887 / DSM 12427 / ZAS-2) TaxID=545694 RepID=F5YIX0_TREPZ|nr:putative lipoprotein [Treponema primitia ZAS-2]